MFHINRTVAAMILAKALLDKGITKPLTIDELLDILDELFASLEIEVEWEA